MMGEIYKGAKDVVVWLGHWDNENFRRVEKAFEFLIYAERHFGESDVAEKFSALFGNDIQKFFDIFRALFCHPYWSRAWIVQEVVLAKTLLIRCGKEQIAWDALDFWTRHSINIFTAIGKTPPTGQYDLPRQEVDHLMDQRLQRSNDPGRHGITEYMFTLPGLIMAFRARGCKEPHDHIYAFMSLVHHSHYQGSMIKANYADDSRAVFFEILNYLQIAERGNQITELQDSVRNAELLVDVLLEKTPFSFHGRDLDIFGTFLNSPNWLPFECYYAGKLSCTGMTSGDSEHRSIVLMVRCVEIKDDRGMPVWSKFEEGALSSPPYLDSSGEQQERHSGLAQLSVELGDHIYMFCQSSLAIAVRPSARVGSGFTIVGKLIVARIPDICDAMLLRRMPEANRGFFRNGMEYDKCSHHQA
jgi:hypothetical protein